MPWRPATYRDRVTARAFDHRTASASTSRGRSGGTLAAYGRTPVGLYVAPPVRFLSAVRDAVYDNPIPTPRCALRIHMHTHAHTHALVGSLTRVSRCCCDFNCSPVVFVAHAEARRRRRRHLRQGRGGPGISDNGSETPAFKCDANHPPIVAQCSLAYHSPARVRLPRRVPLPPAATARHRPPDYTAHLVAPPPPPPLPPSHGCARHRHAATDDDDDDAVVHICACAVH